MLIGLVEIKARRSASSAKSKDAFKSKEPSISAEAKTQLASTLTLCASGDDWQGHHSLQLEQCPQSFSGVCRKRLCIKTWAERGSTQVGHSTKADREHSATWASWVTFVYCDIHDGDRKRYYMGQIHRYCPGESKNMSDIRVSWRRSMRWLIRLPSKHMFLGQMLPRKN